MSSLNRVPRLLSSLIFTSFRHYTTSHFVCRSLSSSSSSTSPLPPPFSVTKAPFNSVSFDASSLTDDVASINAAKWLSTQISSWRHEGLNSVWVTASLPQNARLLGVLTAPDVGFIIHHASGTSITLLKWLPNNTPCRVPQFGGTQIGVGGVTVDRKGRLLLVREKSARSTLWKFPGGLAEPGEDIGVAAVREVWEETGVRTVFCGLLGFRHAHGLSWGLSDIYFLALLRPIAGADGVIDIDPLPIKIDPLEIAEAVWRDGAVYAEETTHPMNATAARLALLASKSNTTTTITTDSEAQQRHLEPFWNNATPEKYGVHLCHDVFIGITKKWTKIYTNEAEISTKKNSNSKLPIAPPPLLRPPTLPWE